MEYLRSVNTEVILFNRASPKTRNLHDYTPQKFEKFPKQIYLTKGLSVNTSSTSALRGAETSDKTTATGKWGFRNLVP